MLRLRQQGERIGKTLSMRFLILQKELAQLAQGNPTSPILFVLIYIIFTFPHIKIEITYASYATEL